jgi:hypothetical protein
MVKGVVEFGLGALVLVALIVLLPRLLSRLEQRQLDSDSPSPESRG